MLDAEALGCYVVEHVFSGPMVSIDHGATTLKGETVWQSHVPLASDSRSPQASSPDLSGRAP